MNNKRILSGFLAFCFLLALCPAPVTATEERPVAPIRQIASTGWDHGDTEYNYNAEIDANGSLWMSGRKIMDSVSSVSLGESYSAAIRTDGSLWMWGNNSYGKLGDGTTEYRSTPVKIMDGVSSVSLYVDHSAAIRTDGSLWMWGGNYYGQLGDGTTEDRSTPVKIMDGVSSVSLGSAHTAAILTDGSLWMWGYNRYGQLGVNTEHDTNSTPVKVMDGVSSVSLGYRHSAVIRTDASLWIWGFNYYGQVGDGTTTDRSAPVKIMDSISSVSLSTWFSAVIDANGSLWMWGGEWGNSGRICYSNVPVKVQDRVSTVSAGGIGGLYILEDKTLWYYTFKAIPPSKSQVELDYLPGVYLNKDNLTLAVNESATMQTYIYPESDRNSALVWMSSNPDVAAVENGVVTAKGAGESDITVMAVKTGDTAVCHVTVPEPLSLDKNALTLRVGETYRLAPTVRRADGEETGVTWFSSAPAIASVSSDGTVSALASGAATVSVVTLDGEYKADCVVTVPNEASGVTLDRNSVTMKPGDSVTLTATVVPEDAVEKDVRWMSSAPGVATVSGGVVKAWSLGKTTVMAVTAYGGFTASCAVNVTEDGLEPKTYTITFHPNGGEVSRTDKTLTDKDAVYGELPAPERKGCNFLGWFTEPGGGTRITPETEVRLTENQTLYAHWVATNVPQISAGGELISDVGRISDFANMNLDGSLIIPDAEDPEDFYSATAFCAVYAATGRMAYLQTWDIDVSDPKNICCIGKVHIPEGVAVSAIKVMILSDELVPLQASGLL